MKDSWLASWLSLLSDFRMSVSYYLHLTGDLNFIAVYSSLNSSEVKNLIKNYRQSFCC